ncbi:MAG: FG-GAP repeat protein [Polyangia bacterium]
MMPIAHPGGVRRVNLWGPQGSRTHRLALLTVFGVALLGSLLVGATREPFRGAASPPAQSQNKALTPSLWAAYVRGQQAGAGRAYDFVASGSQAGAFFSKNPAMELVAQARPGGVQLQPDREGGERERIGMALRSQGCAESPQLVSPAAPTARGNRVEYSRGAVTEWYLNGPLGLEQGFTIARDLGCQRSLVFELELDRGVAATLERKGTLLAMSAGGRRYSYGELYAYDAAGRELPSAMQLAGQRLRLIVDAAGATYPIEIDPRMYTEQARLVASDGAINDTFGVSVAYSGDTAIIGAANRNTARGQAYVFVRTGATWSEQAKLNSSDGITLDNFGAAVAVDGNTAIIGAPQKNGQLGQVYVFVRTGTKWAQQARLTAPDGASGDLFGSAVAISGDTVLVGLSSALRNAAYVFVRTGTMWSEQARLKPADGAAGDRFGLSVALEGDTALVGAPGKAVTGSAGQGQAYVFVRSATTWSEQARLVASDGAAGDRFGQAVALSADTALVGAHRKTVGGNAAQGQAYVFVRAATAWSEQARLSAADGAAQDQFGSSVAASGDIALVGASQAQIGSKPRQGAAYVFNRVDTVWSQYGKLTASNGADEDSFGNAVSTQGSTAVIGAYFRTIGQNSLQGAAYVFGWQQLPEGSACMSSSDCLSGSCAANLCAPVAALTDMGPVPDSSQLAVIGSGYGATCSLAAQRSASPAPLCALGALLALGLLRRRLRAPGREPAVRCGRSTR